MSNIFKSIKISKEEVDKCIEFSKRFMAMKAQKSKLDFGNNKIERNETDSIADTIIGKIGELAFQKLCDELGFQIEVDFEVNDGRHNIDFGQDIHCIEKSGVAKEPVFGIDIKTSRSYSQWLLIEDHKQWASILIFMKADVSADAERNLDVFNRDIDCLYGGYAYFSDFFDANGSPWFSFKSGGKLIKPSTIEKMLRIIGEPINNIFEKSLLHQSYLELRRSEPFDKLHFGPQLKCPSQIGLPLQSLRRSREDLIDLLNFIYEDASLFHSDNKVEVLQATSSLNKKLCSINKSFKFQ